MPIRTPIFIAGSGSAGLCAGAYLARLRIPFVIVEKRDCPLIVGQADGVQIRTCEVYESFGISEELLREAHHIREATFWASDKENPLRRTGHSYDAIPGISHLPNVILNQARMQEMLLERMLAWNNQEVIYNKELISVKVDESSEYPVKALVRDVETGQELEIESKYMIGADGAHSTVRKQLGFKMLGDSTDAVWGVIDFYPKTNFPDIRMKTTLRTCHGTILIIPREGGELVRFYIQLPPGSIAKQVTEQDIVNAAKKMFFPYEIDIIDTYWWSAYSIGQRHADYFDYKNRIFLTGDACHTHSPKAGQGMNTSLQDGYDLGWKLGQIYHGLVDPSKILPTYALERGEVARDLIEFDRYYSKLFTSQDANPEEFNKSYVKSLEFTAGLTKQYQESILTKIQPKTDKILASNLTPGMRIPSPQLVRFCDAKTVRLSTAMPADGRWRIVIFPGDIHTDKSAFDTLNTWGEFLDSADSPPRKYLKNQHDDIDSVIETLVVLYVKRRDFEQNTLHPYFMPETGPYKITNLHKIFADDEGHETGFCRAYERLGITPKRGAVLIIRPDHYVSGIFTMNDQEKVAQFFHDFMLQRN